MRSLIPNRNGENNIREVCYCRFDLQDDDDGGAFVLLVVVVSAAILFLLQHHQHKIKAVSE